jgi:hypothetical protein
MPVGKSVTATRDRVGDTLIPRGTDSRGMGGYTTITDSQTNVESETADGTFTDPVETGVGGNVLVAVTTTGAATLTVEFSATGAFGGEQRAVTVDYDSAQDDQLEQFADLPVEWARAKVSANLTDVDVFGGGV